jgi:hypothetical protein
MALLRQGLLPSIIWVRSYGGQLQWELTVSIYFELFSVAFLAAESRSASHQPALVNHVSAAA